jgi:hypothetical protein
MDITLTPDLAAALNEAARERGVAPEALVVNALREHFLAPHLRIEPRDEWGRGLLSAASDCGISLSNEAVSSQGLYE